MKSLKQLRLLLAILMLAAFSLLFIRFDTFSWLSGLTVFQAGPLSVRPFLWAGLAIMVALLTLTIVAGRIYCSVLCPLGLLQDLFSRAGRLLRRSGYRYLQPAPAIHYTLAAFIAAAAGGGIMLPTAIFEPFAAAGRIFTAIFQPLGAAIFRFAGTLSGSGVSWLGQASLKPADTITTSTAIVFALILAFLSIRWGRIYCNLLCPVGAVLRLAAGFSIFRITMVESNCASCGGCSRVCKSGCIDVSTREVDASRCVSCFNCLDACRFDALTFKRHTGAAESQAPLSSGRRAFAGTLIAAAAGYLLPRSVPAEAGTPETILPPGARNHAQFSSRCISCHLCVTACPSSVIRPSSPYHGLRSIQQPSLSFEKGMCEQNCNLCSQICPSLAIEPIISEHKKFLKIGEVVYKKHLCVVETNGTDCGACAEHCPTQAVKMVPYRNNLMIPETSPEICIGCGSCEHICPVRPEKAIVVKPVAEQTIIKLPTQEKLPESGVNAEFPF